MIYWLFSILYLITSLTFFVVLYFTASWVGIQIHQYIRDITVYQWHWFSYIRNISTVLCFTVMRLHLISILLYHLQATRYMYIYLFCQCICFIVSILLIIIITWNHLEHQDTCSYIINDNNYMKSFRIPRYLFLYYQW